MLTPSILSVSPRLLLSRRKTAAASSSESNASFILRTIVPTMDAISAGSKFKMRSVVKLSSVWIGDSFGSGCMAGAWHGEVTKTPPLAEESFGPTLSSLALGQTPRMVAATQGQLAASSLAMSNSSPVLERSSEPLPTEPTVCPLSVGRDERSESESGPVPGWLVGGTKVPGRDALVAGWGLRPNGTGLKPSLGSVSEPATVAVTTDVLPNGSDEETEEAEEEEEPKRDWNEGVEVGRPVSKATVVAPSNEKAVGRLVAEEVPPTEKAVSRSISVATVEA